MHDISARRLVVTKGKSTILKSISFRVDRGRIVGLIGPSGSGKTTLMRSIVGTQQYSGDLTVLGRPAGHASLRARIGYVSQSPSVYGDLTVQQNLLYFASIAGVGRRRVSQVLGQVDLTPQRGQLVDRLSGGQRARVSLAVALLGDPQVLIMDEPTVGLDPILRESLWGLFRTLADDGRVIMVSSHVMDEADRCDDIMLLRAGKVIAAEPRIDLLRSTGTKTVGAAFYKIIRGDA